MNCKTINKANQCFPVHEKEDAVILQIVNINIAQICNTIKRRGQGRPGPVSRVIRPEDYPDRTTIIKLFSDMAEFR